MYCFSFFSIFSQLILGDHIHVNTVIIKNFLVEESSLYLDIGLCVFSVSWWKQFMGLPFMGVHLTPHLPTLTLLTFLLLCLWGRVCPMVGSGHINAEHSALAYRVCGLRPICVPFYLWWSFSKTKLCNPCFYYMHGVTCRYQQIHSITRMTCHVKITSLIIENFLGHLHRYVAH